MLPGFVESASVVEIASSKVGIQIDAVSGKLAGKLAGILTQMIF